MTVIPRNRAGIRVALALGILGLLGLLGVAEATPAAAETPAGLSVTIADGGKQLASGVDASYTASVVNKGADPVTATLVVTVPSYAKLTTAADGKVSGSDAVWPVTVQPGKTATVKAAARIGTIPKGQYRVTALASVYLGKAAGAPLIRAAVASSIRGVVDPSTVHNAVHKTVVAHKTTGMPMWIVAVAGGVLVALLLGLALFFRFRRRRSLPDQHIL